MGKSTHTCSVCREPFQRYASQVTSDTPTCSRECYNRRMMIDGWEQRHCTQCGERFAALRSARQGMCSYACRDEAKRVREERECARCGSTFERRPKTFRRGHDRAFCSNACRVDQLAEDRTLYATEEERHAAALAASRRWRAENVDAAREATRRYRANNKDKVREADRAARARARSKGSVRIETIHRDVLWERDGGICHLCGKPCDPDDWHADHIVPRSLGGVTSYANMAVSHPFCNTSKGNRPQGEQLRIV